uniref:Uncharacterized protein n=1 Tax=Pseudomonas marincola TaxID=437900 RepID=A0A653DXL4_9PSED
MLAGETQVEQRDIGSAYVRIAGGDGAIRVRTVVMAALEDKRKKVQWVESQRRALARNSQQRSATVARQASRAGTQQPESRLGY